MTRVVVHGLGYIGLPTAAVLADSGYDVVGYDPDPEARERVRTGALSEDEPGLAALVRDVVGDGSLSVVSEIPAGDYHVVCVPTPFDEEEKLADLEYVVDAGLGIADVLREGDTVVLESTVPPSTTTGAFRSTLEADGLDAGEDFSLAHCPETVLPGKMLAEIRENDRLVGGVDERSVRRARELYESFVEGEIVDVDDPTVVEFVKLAQNTYRDTNIALANELARLADDYDIDSREAISLANRHPRVEVHDPGPGVGGHCLPVDPWFLGQHSDELDLIAHAREVNDGMVDFVADILADELGSLAGKRVAILGVAYKGNVDDARGSPGLDLAAELESTEALATADGGVGVEVRLHDPHVSMESVETLPYEEAICGADALVVTTDHDEFESLDPEVANRLLRHPLVVDGKAMLDRQAWEAAGLTVRQI